MQTERPTLAEPAASSQKMKRSFENKRGNYRVGLRRELASKASAI
jgi:hypothetical protein